MVQANKSNLKQAMVFVLLVAFGVSGRLLSDIPNFAPVAAISLFSGVYFSSAMVALMVPVSVMLISDAVIGGYEPLMMITVYTMLMLPVLFRAFLRPYLGRGVLSSIGLVGGSLVASVTFFVTTNFMVWAIWEKMQWDRLIPCYVSALPFFKYTLLSDLFFATVLFGGYELIRVLKTHRSSVHSGVAVSSID